VPLTDDDAILRGAAHTALNHRLRRALVRVALFGLSALLQLARPVMSLYKKLQYSKLLAEFPLEPSDVFIVTYPRSGTTLLQMMAFGLNSGPETEFSHIDHVIPWFEVSGLDGRLDFSRSLARPRFFKTHLPIERLPRGAKYIYVARNVADVTNSYFHHLADDGYSGTLEQFVGEFLRGECPWGSWFEHVESGLKHRTRKDVLFLTYEEVVADLAGAVRKVAKFSEIQLDERNMENLLARCSIQYMRANEVKFHPALSGVKRGRFIGQGRVGSGASELSTAQMNALESKLRAKRAQWRGLDSEIDALVAPWLRHASGPNGVHRPVCDREGSATPSP